MYGLLSWLYSPVFPCLQVTPVTSSQGHSWWEGGRWTCCWCHLVVSCQVPDVSALPSQGPSPLRLTWGLPRILQPSSHPDSSEGQYLIWGQCGINECDFPAQQARLFVCKKDEIWVLATACEHKPLPQPTEQQVTPPASSLFNLFLLHLALFFLPLRTISKTGRSKTFHSFPLFETSLTGRIFPMNRRVGYFPTLKKIFFYQSLSYSHSFW